MNFRSLLYYSYNRRSLVQQLGSLEPDINHKNGGRKEMRRLITAITAILALAAGSALAATQVTTVFTEGFNSGFSDPYTTDGQSYGARFGITAPGIITDGSVSGIEGDGFAALNNNRAADGVATIIGAMDIDLGTVPAAGVIYTFSGDFTWRYGTAARAADLYLHAVQSGFMVDMGSPSTGDANFVFNMASETWATHSFSYTATADDVGKPIRVRIRLADSDQVADLTQLIADNWVVTRETAERTEPLVVDVRADGFIYYYNPSNGEAGFVSNGGLVYEGGVSAGDAIGLCAYENEVYTFGLVTNGASAGQYRVNVVDFSSVDSTASGANLQLGEAGTRNHAYPVDAQRYYM
jgi:hypothetical protein